MTVSTQSDPRWLEWGKRLQAAAQNGLAYAENPFDRERYGQIATIAAEIVAAGSGTAFTEVHDLFSGQIGHATPKVDVRGVVIHDDKVLLVKEWSDGLWSLPGGWADVYDTPSEATVREVFEESGYTACARKLLALYDRTRQGHTPHPFHSYKVFFLCDLLGGEATTSHETPEVGWFAEDDLPPLSLGRTTPTQIHRFFEHYRNPEMPTDFD